METIEEMSIKGLTPDELGIKVKNSPDSTMLRITANNKMQAAKEIEWNFSNVNKQTIIFANDKELLKNNLSLTINFLESLNKDQLEVKGSVFVWQNIPYEKVRHYLSNFSFTEIENFFGNIALFLAWFDEPNKKHSDQFADWSIILATKDRIDKHGEDAKYKLTGHSFNPVYRTRLHDVDDDHSVEKVSIGALRSPAHLLADLDSYPTKGTPSKTEVRNIRKQAGYGMVPQLIIYIVDKDSHNDNPKSKRKPLDFDEDVVGMNIFIPGNDTNKNMATYLSVKPAVDEFEDYMEFEEEGKD